MPWSVISSDTSRTAPVRRQIFVFRTRVLPAESFANAWNALDYNQRDS